MICRTYHRFEPAPQLVNAPYPVSLVRTAGTAYTHYSKRVYMRSR